MTSRMPIKGGWIVIVPCTLALGAYLFLVFLPGMREIHALRADMVTKQQYLSQSAVRAARQKAIEEEETETRKYLAEWHGASNKPGDATQSHDTASLFGELADRFKAVGVTTTMFKPEAKHSYAAVDRIPVSVHCTGTHTQVQALLASLEQVKQRVWIDELVLERSAEAREIMTCELKLAIFVDNFEISD